jgi:hypothetical protein
MEPVQGGSSVGGGENAGSVAVNELFRMKNRDLSLNTATSNRLLWAGFLKSSARFPNRGAIEIAGHEVSYQRLAQRAKRLAATLQEAAGHGAVPLTGIFAYRSVKPDVPSGSNAVHAATINVSISGCRSRI